MTNTDTTIDQIDDMLDKTKEKLDASHKPTAIWFVLDQSSSMLGKKDVTIDGYNQFIVDQKKLPGKAFVAVTKFANTVSPTEGPTPLENVGGLMDYRPSGSTALYDAIGVTCERAEKWQADQVDEYRMLFVIITDGAENCSTDYDQKKIATLISRKTEEGWDLSFLGTTQDALLAAQAINIPQRMTSGYSDTRTGTKKVFGAVGQSVGAYRGASDVDLHVARASATPFFDQDALKDEEEED